MPTRNLSAAKEIHKHRLALHDDVTQPRSQWRKLLWVKQDYPDNWVDPTFLKELKRNVNVHPYDFYSLVADSTVVVQHLSSAVIFVTSFVAIYMNLVSPVSVAVVSTFLTVVGWVIWDLSCEKRQAAAHQESPESALRLRKARVIATAKSALLIYFTLLGLSPILRSLTKGVTSDSIWAIATWLLFANFLGFDYGSGIERSFPASFSTNAAITSSVVLASRLTDTAHVFSLMLFSIQVFGLFPVFRRAVKHMSWALHVALTVGLVLGAGVGLWGVVGGGWAVTWVLGVVAGMGGCAWWMIDLQKYKNEIRGPWDPARPIIRRQWAYE